MRIIIVLIVLLPNLIWAQDKTDFTLQEAIGYAKLHSYAILNANDDIAIANKKVWETTTMGLPQFNTVIDYQNFIKQPVQLIPAEFLGGQPGEFAEISFGTKQNINATATLSQLLFDGSYLVGLQSAQVYLKISESIKEKTALAINETVTNAYAGVLLNQESILILKKNTKILEKNLADTKEIIKNGYAEEQDAEQLQLTLLQVKNELRNLKRLEISNLNMLKYILGISIDINISLTQSLPELYTKLQVIDLVSENFDYTQTIDYKMAGNNTKANELLVKLEQSKMLPSLSAFVNYGVAAYSEEFKFFSNDQKWFDSSLFGVSLNVPIFSSLKRSAKIQQAKIGLQKAERTENETSQKLKLQHQTALLNYQNALETFQTSKEGLALAERIEEKENIKFFEGISSSFQLSTAQNQLYNQQQSYLQAIFNLISKKVALETVLNKY